MTNSLTPAYAWFVSEHEYANDVIVAGRGVKITLQRTDEAVADVKTTMGFDLDSMIEMFLDATWHRMIAAGVVGHYAMKLNITKNSEDLGISITSSIEPSDTND